MLSPEVSRSLSLMALRLDNGHHAALASGAILIIGKRSLPVVPVPLAVTASTISATSLPGLSTAIFLAWLKFGRYVFPACPLSLSYILHKLPLYWRILFARSA